MVGLTRTKQMGHKSRIYVFQYQLMYKVLKAKVKAKITQGGRAMREGERGGTRADEKGSKR